MQRMSASDRLKRLPWEIRYQRWALMRSRIQQLSIMATHRHAHVEFQGPVYLGKGFTLDITGDGSFIVGSGVQFRHHFYCEIGGSGRVTIGEGSYFTYYSHIACSTTIDIGKGCGIGLSTLIVDGSHKYRDLTVPFMEQGYDFTPITIGDGVQIHSNCTIINSIGHHAIIGANTVVTKPIPPYCVAVGAPARVIDYYGPPDERPEGLQLPSR
jgi:acetyltransferase-like isoleucine patch superfamily enzyme